MMRYKEIHDRSLADPEGFWAEAAEAIEWHRTWDSVLETGSAPFHRWFAGGMLNTCHNALDRHVNAGRGDQTALIHDSPVTDSITRFSYRELRDQVAALAGVMRAHGVQKGDRVIIYMPMVPAAPMAMLACARIGAIHSVVFGGFSSAELAKRIDDARPKMILSASCGIEPGRVIEYKPLLDRAIELAGHKPDATLILARPQAEAALTEGRDFDWDTEMSAAEPAECVPVEATHPLYILYTSGTTGQPKGIVRDHGGHAVALAWSMPNVYNVEPGEVFWAASDVGWVVGHSYIVYAPLLIGATTLLFEGKPVGTPDAGTFWRVIEQHDVCTLFTAPTAFRAIAKEDPGGDFIKKYDLSKLRALFLAGERCDPTTLEWAQQQLRHTGDRSLVADRNRLAGGRQLLRARTIAGQARLADLRGAGLRRARARRRRARIARRRDRGHRDQAAAAAGLPGHPVGGRPALPGCLSAALPRLLSDRRRRH